MRYDMTAYRGLGICARPTKSIRTSQISVGRTHTLSGCRRSDILVSLTSGLRLGLRVYRSRQLQHCCGVAHGCNISGCLVSDCSGQRARPC